MSNLRIISKEETELDFEIMIKNNILMSVDEISVSVRFLGYFHKLNDYISNFKMMKWNSHEEEAEAYKHVSRLVNALWNIYNYEDDIKTLSASVYNYEECDDCPEEVIIKTKQELKEAYVLLDIEIKNIEKLFEKNPLL